MKLSFSLTGLVVFALPMLINLAYVLWPPVGDAQPPAGITRWVEIVEKVSRMAYLFAIVLLVSDRALPGKRAYLWLAVVFLALYYAVWLRYFLNGRDPARLGQAFLCVPMPLAVFPVLYYLCAALWLGNLPAAGLMLLFGAAHLTVSIQSFR